LQSGYDADKWDWFEKDRNTIFYVNNIFISLNDIYLKRKQSYYESDDVHDKMILIGLIMFLQRVKKDCVRGEDVTPGTYSNFHFAITIPTHWDYGIREELIRPLFIQAGLISKYEHQDRLLIFTQLESSFRYIQSVEDNEYSKMNTKIGNGRQYIMYVLKLIDSNVIITLDFFSAHYPPITTVDDNFVTKALKSIYFTVPLDFERGGKHLTN
jgi:hypothetical protein